MNTHETNNSNSIEKLDTMQTVQESLVLSRNLTPYEVTKANAKNITPRSCKGGMNPQYDRQEIAMRKEMARTRSEFDIHAKLKAFGVAVWKARDTRNRINKSITHLRGEIEETAISAALLWVANTSDPEGVLDHWLSIEPLARWPKAIYRAAHKEVDKLMRHMSRARADETAYLSLGDETFKDAETGETFDLLATEGEKRDLVRLRCADLRAKAHEMERTATSNRKKGFVRSVLRMIDRAEAYANAAIDSRAFAFSVPVSFSPETETNVSEITIRENKTRTGRRARGTHLNAKSQATGEVVGFEAHEVTTTKGDARMKDVLRYRALRLNRFLREIGA